MAQHMWDLGKRIRDARKKQGLTLKQLAGKSGVSVSFLSEIERGLSQASMGTHRKIFQSLGVSFLCLEQGQDNGFEPWPNSGPQHKGMPYQFKPISEVTVVKSHCRKKLAYPNQKGFYELITPDLNRNLEVLSLSLEPGFDSGPEKIVDPPGEKCLLILSGCLDFNIKGKIHRLNKGDSVSYPADSPLSFSVVGDNNVECLIIITPPGF